MPSPPGVLSRPASLRSERSFAMLIDIARRWWVLLIRGIAAILFGVIAFFWPGITLLALVFLFGIYALADGAAAIALGLTGRSEGGLPWWAMLLVGLLSLAAGIVTFVYPAMTAMVLLIIIAAWAIARGIFEIIAALRLRKIIHHEWLLVLAGILSIAFGIILLTRPLAGALAMIWVISAFAIVFGILAIILSLRLHELKNRLTNPPGTM
jgi:uncharacterized membrane protein HdeD (DUF308 family)